MPYAPLLLGLTRERQALYRRIDERVELELAKGLVEETRGLLARGYGRQLGSMKALGYKQVAGFLAGDYSYEEAVRLLKRDTRRFAKRQLTWFRREPGIRWMPIEDGEPAARTAERVVAEARRFLKQLACPPTLTAAGAE
jgi:tRNA dimethylallyltransferase